MSAAPPDTPSGTVLFFDGVKSAWTSVFAYVLFGTYVGFGALAHDYGFSFLWLTLSTILIWAAPAQLILMSTLAGGAALIEVALAVTLSAVRFLPMVAALLPILRGPETPVRRLLLPTHFTAISMWVESIRLLPQMPRERRVPFCNGLGVGFMSSAVIAGGVGYYLTENLPVLFAAALLFLTPMSFLVSIIRSSSMLVERLAFAFGLLLGPLLAFSKIDLDLMWTGIIGGTAAFAVHRVRRAMP